MKQTQLLGYIESINKSKVVGNATVRTAVAIDGTGSMGGVIAQVCSVLRETFKKTY